MSGNAREPPCRPSLPPLFMAATNAWIAIVMAEQTTWSWRVDPSSMSQTTICMLTPLCLGMLAILAHHLATRRKGHAKSDSILPGSIAIICLSYLVALLCGITYWMGWEINVEELPIALETGEPIYIELVGDPAQKDYGIVSNAQIKQGARTISVRLTWPEDTTPLSAGHRIAVRGTVISPSADEGGRWNHQNGYVGMIRASHVEQSGYAAGLRGLIAPFRDASFERIESIGGEAAGLLAGILLGNRTLYANSELEQAFQTTGLAHLMAVSGTHLAIVTMLISLMLKKMPLRRGARNAAIMAMLLAYCALTGFASSALRACTMCASALLLGTLGQRSHALSGLSLCVFAFLALSPCIAFSMGFQLSVLAVVGLVVFGALTQCWIGRIAPRMPESVTSSLAATIAATFLTLPVTIPQFAQLPLISPLANLLVAPLVTIALCLGMPAIVLSALCPPIGIALLHLAGAMTNACAALVQALADIPGACLPLSNAAAPLAIAFALVVMLLWALWPIPAQDALCPAHSNSKGMLAGVCVCGLLVLPVVLSIVLGFDSSALRASPSQPRIVMLDVGQGDSILVQGGDANILIDTGEEGDVLIRELAEQGVTSLDAILISHKDADHAGALGELAGVVSVKHVYVHEDLLGCEFEQKALQAALWATGGTGAEGVRPGSKLEAGELALTVLAPEDGGKSENDDSLVCLLEYDAEKDGSIEARGLFTGDAESSAMNTVAKAAGDIDFLKVAHHGSKGGLTSEQLATLSPEVALISVGADNKYGHPTRETLDMLESANAQIYRTDQQGAVSISFTPVGMSIAAEKER